MISTLNVWKKNNQKESKTNKDTEIAEEVRNASLQTFGDTKQIDHRLKREMISYLQSRRKKDLILKHSHICERKMSKN